MATFSRGQTVETSDPQIEVETRPLRDPTGAVTLGPGRHVFQLIVEDDRGQRSVADTAEVTVVQTIIRPPIVVGPVVAVPPVVVRGSPSIGSASGSTAKKRKQSKPRPKK